MLKDLVKVSNRLDTLGLTKEADLLDAIIRKIAEDEEETFGLDDSLNPDVKSEFASNLLKNIEAGIGGVTQFLENSVDSFDATSLLKMDKISSFNEIRKAIRSLVNMSEKFSPDDKEKVMSLKEVFYKKFGSDIDRLMRFGQKVRGFHGATGIKRFTLDSNAPGSSKKNIDDPLLEYIDFLRNFVSIIDEFDQKYILQEANKEVSKIP